MEISVSVQTQNLPYKIANVPRQVDMYSSG